MTPVDVVKRFRSDVHDAIVPYLWSDEEAYGYLSAAQEMFCRLTYGIPDSSSSMTQVPIQTNVPWSTFSDRILYVNAMFRKSDGREITAANVGQFKTGAGYRDDYGFCYNASVMQATGQVSEYITDMDQCRIRWIRIPQDSDVAQLSVYRLPTEITVEKVVPLEIPSFHHIYLLWGMEALAYLKKDAETFNAGKASDFKVMFEDYCALAKTEREKRQDKPYKVKFGGIPWGNSSWGSGRRNYHVG
jgi:hypothetical protein